MRLSSPSLALAVSTLLLVPASPANAAAPEAATSAAATALTPHQAKARELLAKVIGFKSFVGADENPQMADYLAAEFKAGGFTDEEVIVRRFEDTAYLVVRYKGQAPKGQAAQKPILLLSHMDVVPALREHWKRDPFKLDEANGFFYGRGTLDVKGGLATLTALFLRLRAEKFVPTRDLIIVFSGDEETTGNTTRELVDHHRDWIDAEYALNTDAGGGTLGPDGEARSYNIQTAEKTYASYKLSTYNPGGHSSQPRADNAIYELADALKQVQAYRFPTMANDTTKAFFKAMAVTTPGELGAAMGAFSANPQDTAAADVLWNSPVYVGATRTTCVATMLRAGHADNALPQQAGATVNCRLFPGTTPKQVEAELQGVVGKNVEVALIGEPRYSDGSPLRKDVVDAVTASVHARHPGIPIIPIQESGATDGLFYRAAGIPTYGISETFIRPQDQFAHGLDERIPVSSYYDGLEHWYRIVKTLVGPAKGKR